MRYNLMNPHLYFIIFGDILLFSLALLLSFHIRFDFSLDQSGWSQFFNILPYALAIKTLIFSAFGLYKGMWRYTDLRDSWRLAQAALISEALLIAVLAWIFRFQGFSRGVFAIDLVLTFVFAGGARVCIRTYFLKKGQFHPPALFTKGRQAWRTSQTKCLIIGAGNTGEKVLREIIENPDISYDTVGFLDDNPAKIGRTLHGVKVLGNIDQLDTIVRREKVDEVLIAMPSAGGTQMRRVVEACEKCDVIFKTMPGIGEIIDGKVTLSMFREVNMQDLLGRKQVSLDHSSISSYLSGKAVMITGAGGSIGSELVRQVARFRPGLILLVEHSESALFAVQMELKHELDFDRYMTILGRVQDRSLMHQVFAQYRPKVIFHAAAYKHVPMLERNPWEAVYNNVLGSKVLMEEANRWEVDRFVLVSTDKAVRPTNVMGASKRVTELTMQAMPVRKTRFVAVRFGNVLGSAGSVIPLFQRQIQRGGPVTVTHPEMTRYFMTIPEACQLIVQAGGMGTGGEIFVLSMGQPVRILDMARDLIRLSGREPDKDIKIEFTGMRPGEKLYEELITHDEGVVETEHRDIMVLRPEKDPHAQTSGLQVRLSELVQDLVQSVSLLSGKAIKTRLKAIVPEYTVSDEDCTILAVSCAEKGEEDDEVLRVGNE